MNLEVRVNAHDVCKRAIQVRGCGIDIEVIKIGVATGVIETVGRVGEIGSTNGHTDVGGTGSLVGVSGYQVPTTSALKEEMCTSNTRSKR